MKTFVLLGLTGAGKSSFVNSVFGPTLAQTGAFEPCTRIVTHYARGTPYGDLKIVDTPGFGEDGPTLDIKTIEEIQKAISGDDYIVAYVTRLNENRFRACEKGAIQLICQRLPVGIWERAFLVLTFAGLVPGNLLGEACSMRKGEIEQFIGSLTKRRNFAFRRTVMIDNMLPNWHADAKPAAAVLSKR